MLIGTDLVATAGHCINSCSGRRFVFDYEMNGANSVNSIVDANDVYSCRQIVARENSGTRDWAVVQLDRDVVGHQPAEIRRSGTVSTGTQLVLGGFPSGLPLKIAPGATVKPGTSSNYFNSTVDSYGGNSGSPVFNANTGVVEGILVRGNNDYDWTGSCYVSNVCSDSNGCGGSYEESTRTTLFDQYVPELDGTGGPVDPPSGCVEDSFEPNDSSSESWLLSRGIYNNLAVCGGADDWFRVPTNAGDTVDVTISFTHADGDVDLELWDGNTRLALSESTTNAESVTGTASGDNLWVRVYGYQSAENDYALEIDVTEGVTLLTLSGPANAGAGTNVTFNYSGSPANERVFLVTGARNGTTDVPGCPGLTADVGNANVIGRSRADASGNGSVSVDVPSRFSGSALDFQAVSINGCSTSEILRVQF